MTKSSFPIVLKLRKGLGWKGKLRIERAMDGGYLVQFDAEVVDPSVAERFVFDRTVLSARQLFDWTGWRAAGKTR